MKKIKSSLLSICGLFLLSPLIASCNEEQFAQVETRINEEVSNILNRLDSLTSQISSLKADYEANVKKLSDKHLEDINSLTNQIASNKTALEALTTAYNAKVTELVTKITAVENDLEDAKNDNDEKHEELDAKHDSLTSSLAALRTEYETKAQELEASIASAMGQISALDEKYEAAIENLREDYEGKLGTLRQSYESAVASINTQLSSLSSTDTEILRRLAELEQRVNLLEVVNTYTVTFNPDNGSDPFTQVVTEHNLVSKPTNPVKEGYTFYGWYDSFGDKWLFGQSTPSTNLTLTAVYSANTYTVNLNANGGEIVGGISSMDVEFNKPYSLPSATKEGYKFLGWSYQNEMVTDYSHYPHPMDVTYVAQYSELFKVYFNTDGGNEIEPVAYHTNTLSNLPIPTKDGYKFGGWFIGSTNIENGYVNTSEMDLTLKASWIDTSALFEYQIVDDSVRLLKYVGDEDEVEIPNAIRGKEVSYVDPNLFMETNDFASFFYSCDSALIPNGLLKYCTNIEKISVCSNFSLSLKELFGVTSASLIPNTLETIEFKKTNGTLVIPSRLFIGVMKAFNFIIPNDLSYMPNISSNVNIRAINIPETIETIYSRDFENCTALTSIVLPENVKTIYDSAFVGCTSLASITIPDDCKYIGEWAFEDCTALTSIVLPEKITNIKTGLFARCSSLTHVALPEGITSIGAYAFDGCGSLTSINLPVGITNISASSFNGCRSLTSISIPEGVASIETWAFMGCSSLTSVVIPEGVARIDSYAFGACDNLSDVYFQGTEEEWNAITFSGGNDSLLNATIHYNSNI